MNRLPIDPELAQLVNELNAPSGGAERPVRRYLERPEVHAVEEEPVHSEDAQPSGQLARLLEEMIRRRASDLLVVSDAAPALRVDGALQFLPQAAIPADTVRSLFATHLGTRGSRQQAVDFSFSFRIPSGEDLRTYRFRGNYHHQLGNPAVAIRLLHDTIPTLRDLQLPETLAQLVEPARGLVLMCGATGSGKSSTTAALIDHLNRTAARHVITIEDPVEYIHTNKRSLIEHIEVGRDADTFANALRAALRQDPDVIVVGEMRDLETATTAITAAETGHLIFATLHTNDAAQSINRVVDIFPPAQHTQIYAQLALALNAIVCQQLVPAADGRGRLPVLEYLIANYAIRNHIRHARLQNLYNEIVLGKRSGMMTFEDSLARFVRAGRLRLEDASLRAAHPDELRHLLQSS